jgi:FixJ family two-component response regulator
MTNETVCVVDDHAQVLAAIATLLRVANFEVKTFGSAKAFLEYCVGDALDDIDCLVLDVRMPGMSGIELQKELNKRDIDKPVVLMSADVSRLVAEFGRKNGAATLLEKPFDGITLVAAIKKAMSPPEN